MGKKKSHAKVSKALRFLLDSLEKCVYFQTVVGFASLEHVWKNCFYYKCLIGNGAVQKSFAFSVCNFIFYQMFPDTLQTIQISNNK